MTRSRDNAWLILRTSSSNTLRLAQSLAWASIEAWAPAVTVKKRAGALRRHKAERVPVMPQYVFARTEHLFDLLAIHEAPSSPHPKFSFMRTVGEIRPIADNALDNLRIAEAKGKPIEEARQWQLGERVRYPAAGFEGLIGTVERRKGKSVWVRFASHPWPIEAPGFVLFAAEEGERKAA